MMLPHIDALHVMGYSETGSKSAGWRSYDFIKTAAGKYSCKLLIGVPSHTANWENKSVQEHLELGCKRQIRWPGNLGCSTERSQEPKKWRTKVWKTISRIRQGAELNGTDSPMENISSEKNQEVKR